jgi:uncharacterized membrane protein YphA (DoxX/SURF4 family)
MGHLGSYQQLRGYAASKRIPAAGPAVLISGVAIALAGVGIAAGIWPDLAALILAIFLFLTAFLMHNFWTIQDAGTRAADMVHFQKDLALMGAALVVFAVTAYGGEFGPTLTDPLFDL